MNGSYLVRFVIELQMGVIHLTAFSSSPSLWLCKDAHVARNKKGTSVLLLSTRLLASNAACRSGNFKLPLTVSLFIV